MGCNGKVNHKLLILDQYDKDMSCRCSQSLTHFLETFVSFPVQLT